MRTDHIKLERDVSLRPLGRRWNDLQFEKMWGAQDTMASLRFFELVFDDVLRNAYVLTYQASEKGVKEDWVNACLGAVQLNRMNFWAGTYYCQRAMALPETEFLVGDAVRRLWVLRTPNGWRSNSVTGPTVVFLPQRKQTLRPSALYSRIIQREPQFPNNLSGEAAESCLDGAKEYMIFAACLVWNALARAEENYREGNRSFEIKFILARLRLISLQPGAALLLLREGLEIAEERCDHALIGQLRRLSAYAYDLVGDSENAAKEMRGLTAASMAAVPGTIVEGYKFLKHAGNLEDTVLFMRRAYKVTRQTRRISPRLDELNSAKNSFRVRQFLGGVKRVPPILISTTSKSGSTYLPKVLCEKLGVPSTKIFAEIAEEHHRHIIPEALAVFSRGGVVCRQHFEPDGNILAMLADRGITRVLFHTRDPRQALVSWVFYMEAVLRKYSCPSGQVIGMSPFAYGEMSFAEKIDFHLQTFVPRTVQMIEKWMVVSRSRPKGIHVKITRFEDMVDDPERFFSDVLGFFDARGNPVLTPLITSLRRMFRKDGANTKKRKGKKDEWRSILTGAQMGRVNAMISHEVRKLYPE